LKKNGGHTSTRTNLLATLRGEKETSLLQQSMELDTWLPNGKEMRPIPSSSIGYSTEQFDIIIT